MAAPTRASVLVVDDEADIRESLRMHEPFEWRSGIERPNLFLAGTSVFEAEEKLPLLADRVRRIDGPGIVYSTLIKDLEILHGELARSGIRCLVYHGKLSGEERRRMQERLQVQIGITLPPFRRVQTNGHSSSPPLASRRWPEAGRVRATSDNILRGA